MILEVIVFGTVGVVAAVVARRQSRGAQLRVARRDVLALHRAPAVVERPDSVDWPFVRAALESVPEEVELQALGYVTIGSLITPKSLSNNRIAMRAMVSADKLVQVRIGRTTMTHTSFVSFGSTSADADDVVTVRESNAMRSITRAPHIDRLARPDTMSLPSVEALHRERMQKLPDRVEFHDLDDVLDVHAKVRARTIAWFEAQDKAALVEADVRALQAPDMPRAVVVPKREP